jgi:prevent-host-death family protein
VTTFYDHKGDAMQTAIGAGEFKAKCLQLLDDVALQRGTLIITKHGKPVAKLVPVEPEKQLFGSMKGSVISAIDIISPIDIEWEASK